LFNNCVFTHFAVISLESSDDENEKIKSYYKNPQMWQSTFKKLQPVESGISPVVRGIGGCWGFESLDPFSSNG
jgi:hypothetical protein